ncbi:hypothetical protein HP499_17160 [Paenarthrobacter sp. CM16]|uniref:hypothetical protein n=1 Tax=Paenarthrobacter sp. CM16 TaxID=2738447 RepID=UPI0015542BA0|nr:hypothetical protein [Paenarthrobacter sp. CM16]NQD89515.1 hypothetical protein [Paenarthrobacter sp. CM16]
MAMKFRQAQPKLQFFCLMKEFISVRIIRRFYCRHPEVEVGGGQQVTANPPPTWRARNYRRLFRGLMKMFSLPAVLARFSARFSRMVFPGFFDFALSGDFPDIPITPFVVALSSPYLLLFLMPVVKLFACWQRRRGTFPPGPLAGTAVRC